MTDDLRVGEFGRSLDTTAGMALIHPKLSSHSSAPATCSSSLAHLDDWTAQTKGLEGTFDFWSFSVPLAVHHRGLPSYLLLRLCPCLNTASVVSFLDGHNRLLTGLSALTPAFISNLFASQLPPKGSLKYVN